MNTLTDSCCSYPDILTLLRQGHFGLFSGTFDFDEDKTLFTSAKADIFTETINTGSEKRDKVLRSEDFFDEKNIPIFISP